MRATFRRFLTDTAGATAIEYGLIAGLISMAILVGVGATGNSVGTLWSDNANELADAIGD
jgi:pilus assembly protein Flp/PilA